MTNSALAERTEARQVASPAATNESTAMLTMIQRAATDPAFDADKMQKMMEMYERHTDRTAAAAFNAAMVRAQAEIGPVFRDKFNAQTNSAYAALESIDRKISPVYTLHGFSLSFGTGDSPLVGHIRTVCDCMHEAGHTKTYHVDLPIDSAGIKGSVNKTGVHASGSTFSYARRYLTMMIFNVVLTNEDNDGNGDEGQRQAVVALVVQSRPVSDGATRIEPGGAHKNGGGAEATRQALELDAVNLLAAGLESGVLNPVEGDGAAARLHAALSGIQESMATLAESRDSAVEKSELLQKQVDDLLAQAEKDRLAAASDPLAELTAAQLKEQLDAKGIAYKSGDLKPELLALLKAAQ